ncbi:MAG: hypothetical protein JSW72_01765, partial [Candidatus Bathyarchaeota archaeon]
MNKINQLFERKVEVPRIYLGKKQALETLINEEAILFAGYLRDEAKVNHGTRELGWNLKHPIHQNLQTEEKKEVVEALACLTICF